MDVLSSAKLKAAMLDSAIGVTALAKKAVLSPAIVSKLLKKDSAVRLPTVAKISRALGVDAEDLLKED